MKKIDLYSADGYKCSKTCMDFDQPTKAERKNEQINLWKFLLKIVKEDQSCLSIGL